MNKNRQKKTEGKSEDKQQDTEQDFARFITSAIRQPRGGIYEHLLSQFMAQAVICTDPLKRIKIVTEAALMIPESERNSLAIDYGRIKVLNFVSNALLNPSIRKPEKGFDIVSIPWGFPENEQNFKDFIAPWFNYKVLFWPDLIKEHIEIWRVWECRWCGEELARRKLPYSDKPEMPRKCPKCKKEVISRYGKIDWSRRYNIRKITQNPFWSYFYEVSQCLSKEGYDSLRLDFCAWAMPQAQLFLAELARAVSPSLYGEILGLYTKHGKKGYAEKVKEVSEMPTDEDSLDSRL